MPWQGESSVSDHKHDFVEIAFILKGSCIHTYQDSNVRLIPGDVFTITPHQNHAYTIDSPMVIYNCMFYPQALGEDWLRLQTISSLHDMFVAERFSHMQEILHLAPSQINDILVILDRMHKESKQLNPDFGLIQKSNLTLLLCTLGRARDWQEQEENTIYNRKRELVALALEYMEQHLQGDLSVDEIASHIYLSPGHFRKVFKETMGLSPINYINKLRISNACQLLKEDRSISEIAERVGIQDHTYFSRLFKKLVGQTPSDYRRHAICTHP
nr:AraC family transcriptional regulator [Pullulanibacillus pueri]